MQSIEPIHVIKFKVNSRQQFSPTIYKTKTTDLIETFKLTDGDLIYLYTKDAHDAIQDIQTKYNKLNNNASAELDKLKSDDRTAELEKALKIAESKLSDIDDNLDKAKQNVLDADNIKTELRKTIEIKDNTINERTNQLNELKADLKDLQEKYNDEVKSNADKISKLTAGINYIIDAITTKNRLIRWIGGLDKTVKMIEDLKNIKASTEPKAIETVKYRVPEDASNDI